MNKLFNINNINFLNIDTTVLFSKYKLNSDAIELLNNNCEVITKNNPTNIEDIPLSYLEEFNCLELKNKRTLTKTDEIKLNILSSLVSPKKVIVFLNVLTYVDKSFKTKIIKYLKENKKIIINYTSEIEETLLLEYLIVIHNDVLIMEGMKEDILKEEKILKKIGFNLPFIVELSNGLKYYNLIDKTYYDSASLVGVLWK